MFNYIFYAYFSTAGSGMKINKYLDPVDLNRPNTDL